VPDKWESFTVKYRYRNTFYHISVKQTDKQKDGMMVISDGQPQKDKSISLVDDGGDHSVEVHISPREIKSPQTLLQEKM
jgi:cellobiose phosphorylase